ncbi:MAG: DUF58 domain-containing protein [Phycisphaerales bacterium]
MPQIIRNNAPLLIALVLIGIGLLAAMNTQNNLLFWVIGLTVGALTVSTVYAFLSLRKIDVVRLDPKHGIAGEPLVMRYELTSRHRFLPVFNIQIEEIESSRSDSNWHNFTAPARAWVMHLGPGETLHGEAVMWPMRRGEMKLARLRISSTFPFGLIRTTRRLDEATHTLIFPRLFSLRKRVLDAIVPAGPLGARLSSLAGMGDDYFGLREYRLGDSRRQIAWKRSAASDTLITRERSKPSPPRLRVVLNLLQPTSALDAGRPADDRISGRDLEERAISLTASFLESAALAGFEVGLTVLGCAAPVTPLRRSHWHIEKIMGSLASINLDAERDAQTVRNMADAERAGLVVIHAGQVDPSVVRGDAWHFTAMHMMQFVQPRAAVGTRVARAGELEHAA